MWLQQKSVRICMYVCHYAASRPKLPEGEEMTTSADQQSGRNLTKLGEIWTVVGDVNQPEINNFNDSFRIPKKPTVTAFIYLFIAFLWLNKKHCYYD